MENSSLRTPHIILTDLQRALLQNPRDPTLLTSVADTLGQIGQWESARDHWHQLLIYHPRNAMGWLGLGHANVVLGDFANAIFAYHRALTFDPRRADAYSSLALIYHRQGNAADAISLYIEAIRRDPQSVMTLHNLAALLEEEFQFSKARALLQRCIKLAPYFAAAHSRLASVMQASCMSQPALNHMRQAIRFAPNDPVITSNYLLAINYQPELDQAAITAEHQRCMQPAVTRIPNHPASRKAGYSRLRIGYLSGDFRRHSVYYFIAPLISHHARDNIEAIAFSYTAHEDEASAHLRTHFSQWVRCAEAGTEELVRLIEQAELDVLIDLSGHTGPNRWPVLARKPAACIATYLGYPTTTGLTTVDYRISDPIVDPLEWESTTQERVLRLPGSYYCYQPPGDAPVVAETPALQRGHITFGSFNNLAKLSDPCIALWARVITSVPHSCLMIKGRGLTCDSELATQMRARLATLGIAPHRVILAEHTSTVTAHMTNYADIDIALDTFPYNGATTTCEALWMGVPVLTRIGLTHAGRMGASLLHAAGCADDITDNDDAFITRACTLAGDVTALASRRRTQRDMLRASKLMNAVAFTRDFEAALVCM